MKRFKYVPDPRILMRWLPALILILLVLGCTPRTPEQNLNYRTGTEGIVVNFAKDSPPAKLYQGTELSLVLEIKNKGAFTSTNSLGSIYLHGFDPKALSLDGSSAMVSRPIPATTGKSPYVPEGGYNVIEFPKMTVKVPFGDSTTQKIMATTCYEYQTIATPNVCVASNPTALFRDRVCEPKPVTLTNQGAPIAVTKVEEEVMDNAVAFFVTVQNVGGGRVIDKDALKLNLCPSGLKYDSVNIVGFKASLSDYQVACNPADSKLRLVDNKGVFFCRFDVPTQTTYQSPLNIILDYGYSSSVTRDLQIVRPPGSAYSPVVTYQDIT
jgi:hypothetical protein